MHVQVGRLEMNSVKSLSDIGEDDIGTDCLFGMSHSRSEILLLLGWDLSR